MKYVYTVWFRNETLPSDDPEYEWPACFVIDAAMDKAAQAWGDHLSKKYTSTHGDQFVRSWVEAVEGTTLPGVAALPVVAEGEEATDEDIGW